MGFFGKVKKGFTDYKDIAKLKAEKKQRINEEREKMELKRLEAENRSLEQKAMLQEQRSKRQEKIKSLKKKQFDNSAVGKVISGFDNNQSLNQGKVFQQPFGGANNMSMFGNEFQQQPQQQNSSYSYKKVPIVKKKKKPKYKYVKVYKKPKQEPPKMPFGGSGIEW